MLPAIDPSRTEWSRRYIPGGMWTGVGAAVLVALAVIFVLMAFGQGIGIGRASPDGAEWLGRGVWVILTLGGAMFVGAVTGGQFVALPRIRDALGFGLVVWAATLVALFALGALGREPVVFAAPARAGALEPGGIVAFVGTITGLLTALGGAVLSVYGRGLPESVGAAARDWWGGGERGAVGDKPEHPHPVTNHALGVSHTGAPPYHTLRETEDDAEAY